MPFKNRKPQKGALLIASPTQSDSYFQKSVVLLAEHGPNGSLGFILNKSLHMSLNHLVDFDSSEEVFFGGPVGKDNLYFVHSLGHQVDGAIPIAENLSWGGEFEWMKNALAQEQVPYKNARFFVGYSGWESGQLQAEIADKAWIVTPPFDASILLTSPPYLWQILVSQLAPDLNKVPFLEDN